MDTWTPSRQISIDSPAKTNGANLATDRGQVDYFDPSYKELAASLARALPHLPLIQFVSTSADEQQILIFAASDIDPGHYYVFDRASKRLNEIMLARPALEGV